ncbi:glycoside hydrolase family 43 protein [Schizophyllum commune H4-8]|uniref:Glycoside hydrolase family 43 protein n=1 Tax=Schizophyllum commune (strain H4-8 / FGSC 9210) TaxID=578458 RepID=D8Q963_SCHCM|nr:glycoside hydrolase family 43 protein [Schizophyllum commune H4-8]KAI5890537.1 glycoside hydrolase family 43 protein [Schizophyllum commune H4-8]
MHLLGLAVAIISFASQLLSVVAFTNPIKDPNGSDPFMVYHEGYYYLMSTTWSNLQISRGATIQELKDSTPKVIWTDTNADRCCNVWAPEIHWSDVYLLMPDEGAWFMYAILLLYPSYYSAGTSGTLDNQKLHVLKGSSNIIWDSEWSYAGRIVIPNRDVWAIDGTVLVYGDNRYLVYSSWDGDYQCLWISQMTSATEVGNTVKIATPTYDWEKVGTYVNEGPAGLYHGGRTFIVFSASSCNGDGYKLGLLELTGSDPLNASSWTKSSEPIFTSANGNYQPGHNGFFLSASGDQTWNVYHASPSSPGACDGSRYTNVQQVSFDSNSYPNLGSPLALSSEIADPV